MSRTPHGYFKETVRTVAAIYFVQFQPLLFFTYISLIDVRFLKQSSLTYCMELFERSLKKLMRSLSVYSVDKLKANQVANRKEREIFTFDRNIKKGRKKETGIQAKQKKIIKY